MGAASHPIPKASRVPAQGPGRLASRTSPPSPQPSRRAPTGPTVGFLPGWALRSARPEPRFRASPWGPSLRGWVEGRRHRGAPLSASLESGYFEHHPGVELPDHLRLVVRLRCSSLSPRRPSSADGAPRPSASRSGPGIGAHPTAGRARASRASLGPCECFEPDRRAPARAGAW